MDVTDSEDPIPELVESRWLRDLARSLVADPDEVEDAVQATAIAAFEHLPAKQASARGWLATVLKNFVRQRRRSEARRAAREIRAAEREALPSTAKLVERLHAHRRLVEAVEALAEPYRATILLRYFEERMPSEIARLQAVPLATVKSRLARGLALLRGRLDRESGGDGRSWLAALLPLSVRPESALVTTVGATLLNLKLAVPIAAVAVAGIASLWLWTGGSSAPPRIDGQNQSPNAAPATAPAPISSRGPDPARAEIAVDLPRAAAPSRPAPPAPAGPRPEPPMRGRVIDCAGAPVGSVEVLLVDADAKEAPARPAPSTRSGQDGRFEIDPAGFTVRDPRLIVRDDALAVVCSARPATRDSTDDSVIVVARTAFIGGRVLDENDRPLSGAALAVQLPSDFRARFREVLDRSILEPFETVSDAAGAFHVDRAPLVDGATLAVRLDGFEPAYEPLPPRSVADLRIVLHRPGRAEKTITGVVVDPAGALVAHARVLVRGESTVTDEHGRFTADTDDARFISRLSQRFGEPEPRVKQFLAGSGIGRDSALGARIIALKEGFAPGTVEVPVGADGPLFPAFVVVTLGPPPLAITGRVVDPDGAPVAGAQVWIDDPHFVGLDEEGGRPILAENLLSRGAAGSAGSLWRSVGSRDDGTFEIDGLEDRLYRVVAMDPRTLLRVSRPSVAPGGDRAVLQFPKSAVHDEVHGRVVTRAGDPVANVQIHTQCDAFHIAGNTCHAAGEPITTGPDGGFTIENVPKEGVYLRVDGDEILPVEFGREKPALADATGGRVDDVKIVVSVRQHLRVDLADAASLDSFEVHDAAGRALPIDIVFGNGRRTVDRMRLENGTSGVVSIPDDAATIVLYFGDSEVKRAALVLKAGQVNVVRP